MYHVGRPGEDGYANRVLQAWGVDGHNSHTNVCSSSARLGHFLWCGNDRPSPDYANARDDPAALVAPRDRALLQPARAADHRSAVERRDADHRSTRGCRTRRRRPNIWMPAYPGTEGALLLAMANVILDEDLLRPRVRARLGELARLPPRRSAGPRRHLRQLHRRAEGALRAVHAGVRRGGNRRGGGADRRGGARHRPRRGAVRTHSWRAAAAGNLWGWQITRCLYLLVVLTGSVGTVAASDLHVTNKFVPKHPDPPPAPDYWNELLFPREFPLAFFEMSFLLPHFLKEERGKLDVYFTRVYNPLWTNPDGFSWMEMLPDKDKIGLHVALSPTWSETAWFADYILPMGLGTERHDTMSQETHAGAVARVPSAGAARRAREARRDSQRHLRIESRRGVGGKRVLGRAHLEDRSRRLARHPPALRVARTAPASRSRWTSTTGGCSRTRCRGCRRRPRRRR